ncbi:LOW QUALITY PROTEIN: hypothetical protein CVT25_006900 [Psilocybe cyanescens]|uniref:Uncharacterized protein n=1 Tax=Psilocybe cyanescens TaxID=93625 RepID=A0A409X669_PSICY|nr:LOW QUALITY PROTEIN: hypothetical protein CVT25_006900 [Psilocybe cyanescens]
MHSSSFSDRQPHPDALKTLYSYFTSSYTQTPTMLRIATRIATIRAFLFLGLGLNAVLNNVVAQSVTINDLPSCALPCASKAAADNNCSLTQLSNVPKVYAASKTGGPRMGKLLNRPPIRHKPLSQRTRPHRNRPAPRLLLPPVPPRDPRPPHPPPRLLPQEPRYPFLVTVSVERQTVTSSSTSEGGSSTVVAVQTVLVPPPGLSGSGDPGSDSDSAGSGGSSGAAAVRVTLAMGVEGVVGVLRGLWGVL